jgi:hypothetical protein
LTDDIEHKLTLKYYPTEHQPSYIQIQDLLLEELEEIISKNGSNINKYNMPRK